MGTAPSPWSSWLENCTILRYPGLHSYPATAFNSLFYSSKLGCNGNRECLSIVTNGFPQEGTFPHCPSTPQPIFPALPHHKFHMLSHTRILLLLKLFPNTFWFLDACSQKHIDCNRRSCGSPWKNRNYNCIFLFLSCRINIFSIHICISLEMLPWDEIPATSTLVCLILFPRGTNISKPPFNSLFPGKFRTMRVIGQQMGRF